MDYQEYQLKQLCYIEAIKNSIHEIKNIFDEEDRGRVVNELEKLLEDYVSLRKRHF